MTEGPGQSIDLVERVGLVGWLVEHSVSPAMHEVMPYLDKIADNACAIGAVNTILVEGGKLMGHNTDGHGFLATLQDAGFEPSGPALSFDDCALESQPCSDF